MSKIVRITSRVEGFRRAGVPHSKTPTDYPLETFTRAQLKALEAETRLTVEVLEAEDEEPKTKRPNATETIKLIEAVKNLSELAAFFDGEERKTVLEALTRRSEELGQAAASEQKD
jgi:hypothetical protein